MRKITFFLLCSFLLFSCVPAPQTPTQTITVYATSAAEPWLRGLFVCAADLSLTLKVSAQSPDIYLRLGEPETFVSPVYQIGEEEILVVAQRESAVQNLTLAEVRKLFADGNPSAQVWGYASGTDMQIVFDQFVMEERSVSSSVRVAFSVQNMVDVLKSEPAAIGILPRQMLTDDLRAVYSVGKVPVLAVVKENAAGQAETLLACLSN